MPSQTFPEATFDIQEREIPRILNTFSRFLGKEILKRRIELAEKMLAGASPTMERCSSAPNNFYGLECATISVHKPRSLRTSIFLGR
jgi:hypothetical protein